MVKVVEEEEMVGFERMKEKIMGCERGGDGMDKGRGGFVDKVKKEYEYMGDKGGMEEVVGREEGWGE